MTDEYQRSIVQTLARRLGEPRKNIQVVVGPRQTGKSTALRQLISYDIGMPHHLVRASQSGKSTRDWLRREWNEARLLARNGNRAVLMVDEVQMVDQWSSVVKDLWDADCDNGIQLHVVLTGSSSLLLQSGLQESLAGRFELIRCMQWDYSECRKAFGFSLDRYLYYGGYPGASFYASDETRWLDYLNESIIEPSISKDIISMEDVRKPALMQKLFYLGASYSGQEISFRKLLGQLDDAGNTVTIAHYLDLLRDAGLMAGLQKYFEKPLKTRASSPRLAVFDTSLMVAAYGQYREFLLTDPERKGHLVESAVGAYLLKRSQRDHFEVFWWRDGNDEVDFVIQSGSARTAIEVKSGRVKRLSGLDAFCARFPGTHSLVVGSEDAPLESFLLGDIPLFV